jgi:hypothetical protein
LWFFNSFFLLRFSSKYFLAYLIKFTAHNQSKIERLTGSNFGNQQMWTLRFFSHLQKFYFLFQPNYFSYLLHYWLIPDDDDDEFVS